MDHLRHRTTSSKFAVVSFSIKVIITILLAMGLSMGWVSPQWSVKAALASEVRKELQLVLPEYIDDPNYKVVFKNPSKSPVEITVDGKTYKDVKSPFKLPGLSVGKHRIIFKFTNKQGVLRVLPLDIVVVPRGVRFAKGLKTLVYQPEPLVVSGTGTPRSEVLLIINGLEHKLLKVAIDGKWTYTVPNPKLGTYTFLAFALKDGIINPKPVKLVVEYKPTHPITRTQPSSPGGQKKSVTEQIRNYIKENAEYFYAGVLGLTSMLVAYLVVKLRRYLREKQEEKTLAELLGLGDDKTIVEILSSSGGRKKKTKKAKKSEKKRGKKPTKSRAKSKKGSSSSKKTGVDLLVSKKVLTKEEFLKKFKKKGDKS